MIGLNLVFERCKVCQELILINLQMWVFYQQRLESQPYPALPIDQGTVTIEAQRIIVIIIQWHLIQFPPVTRTS